MDINDPKYVDCAMQALEEGIRAQEIKEECACRMGRPSVEQPTNQPEKE